MMVVVVWWCTAAARERKEEEISVRSSLHEMEMEDLIVGMSYQHIRHIHQLDTTYRPFHSEQHIDSTVMHDKEFTKELITPFENPKSEFRSKRRLYETPGYVESSSPELDLFFDIQKHSTTEIMTVTMEQYMSKTRGNYGPGVIRPKINDKTHFELKGQYLKELRKNTFSGSEHEDTSKKSLRSLTYFIFQRFLKIK
ncbi:hypothetical protein Tco_0672348 [Tanacetum coccineum]